MKHFYLSLFLPLAVIAAPLPKFHLWLSQVGTHQKESLYSKLFELGDPNALAVVEGGLSGLTHLALFGVVAVQNKKSSGIFQAFRTVLNKKSTNPNIVMTFEKVGHQLSTFEQSLGLEYLFFTPDPNIPFTHGPAGRFSLFGLICGHGIHSRQNVNRGALDMAEVLFLSSNFDLNGISSDLSYVAPCPNRNLLRYSIFRDILMNIIHANKHRDGDSPSSFDYALKILEKFALANEKRKVDIKEYHERVEVRKLLFLAALQKEGNNSIFAQLPREVFLHLVDTYFPNLKKPLPAFDCDAADSAQILHLIKQWDIVKVNKFVRMVMPHNFEIEGQRLHDAVEVYTETYRHAFWAETTARQLLRLK